MNKQRDALDALEGIHPGNMTPMAEQAWNKAINAIREALAEPEKTNQCGETCERAKLCAVCAGGVSKNEQEPVAWMCADEDMTRKGYSRFSRNCEGEWNIPVYTAPPTRKPLSYMEACTFIALNIDGGAESLEMQSQLVDLIRAIERAHGIGD